MPNGKDGIYGFVSSKSDSVFVVPIDAGGNTYLVQQEHYTTRKLAWQCIAGRTDGEPAEVAAKRELLEEAGLAADQITILTKAYTATGMTTFRTSICLAENLSEDMSRFDSDEISQVKKVPLTEIPELIFSGEIATTESIAALMLAIEFLKSSRKNHAAH